MKAFSAVHCDIKVIQAITLERQATVTTRRKNETLEN
jgi:hypothetical protein